MASMMCPLRALQDMRAIRLGIRGNSLPRAYLRSLTSTATSHHPPQRHSGARSASPLPSARATIPRETRILSRAASFHSSPAGGLRKRAHNDEEIPDSAPTTDFTRMDMLGTAPVPSTSVDICSSDGFKLNSGVSVYDGKGLLLVDGEAFEWQPWGPDKRLVNTKGQWEVPEGAFGVLDLLWPRPDLLILGLGPEMRPLSPATRRYISSLGLRVEVLDTRNAASQFNMLATERGVEDVAAALIPIGWREGVGADWD